MFYPFCKDVSDFQKFAYKLSLYFPIAEDSTDKPFLSVQSNMYNKKNYRAGSTTCNEPRLIGDILAEMFSSNSPLAKAISQSVASHKYATAERKADTEDADSEGKAAAAGNSGWFRNTELCSDIKTYLCFDRIAKIGKVYKGLLRRDSDDHFSFFECRPSANAIIRNPHVFEGKYINVTRRLKDGHIRFNFKEVDFGGRFNPMNFAIGVMKEIIMAFKCLGEEADWRAEKESTGD